MHGQFSPRTQTCHKESSHTDLPTLNANARLPLGGNRFKAPTPNKYPFKIAREQGSTEGEKEEYYEIPTIPWTPQRTVCEKKSKKETRCINDAETLDPTTLYIGTLLGRRLT
jgi:hypothetical protein